MDIDYFVHPGCLFAFSVGSTSESWLIFRFSTINEDEKTVDRTIGQALKHIPFQPPPALIEKKNELDKHFFTDPKLLNTWWSTVSVLTHIIWLNGQSQSLANAGNRSSSCKLHSC